MNGERGTRNDNDDDDENLATSTKLTDKVNRAVSALTSDKGAINRAEHFNRSAASLTGTEGAYSKL